MPVEHIAPSSAAPTDRLSLAASVIRGADPSSPFPGTNTVVCVCAVVED